MVESRRPARIAILGAESTGKSVLARELARDLGGTVVEEYLREFCDRQQRTPRADEQAAIVAEQLRRERAAMCLARARGLHWVFCDTTAIMTALYSQHVFGDHGLMDSALSEQSKYSHTLLCLPDIEWVADGIQRISVEVRADIHARLLDVLDRNRIRWAPVSGLGPARLESAKAGLRHMM